VYTDPDEDEHFGVADSVLALGDSDHGELRRTGTSRHQITYLQQELFKKGESVYMRAFKKGLVLSTARS
jgi:hypothetical protein